MSKPEDKRQSGICWTAQQREAIEHSTGSVLVSAAAGAGKTEVLARHCAELINTSKPSCEINELLVVTFTEAAAAEMRERIGRIIRELNEQDPQNEHLAQQAFVVCTAAISTIHSFCQGVLRSNFARAGLDPEFRIMDADEAVLMQDAALEDVFEELYLDQGESGEAFRELVSLYGNGEDRQLAELVKKLGNFLGSLVSPELWCEKARQWLGTSGDKPGKEILKAWGQLLAEKFQQRMAVCKHNAAKIRGLLQQARLSSLNPEELARLMRFAELLEGALDGWSALAEQAKGAEFDGLACGLEEMIIKRIPVSPKADDESGSAAIAQIKDLLRGGLSRKSCEDLLELAQMDTGDRQLANQDSGRFGRMVLELAKRLREKYAQVKQRENRLDFGDLERKCFQLLNDCEGEELIPSAVAKKLQDRYRYVLVDEYQDINPLQNAILRLASRELDAKREDNLFAVGDLKQSIYRFRLAEPGIFRQRLLGQTVKAGKVIDLQSNFRSRVGILNAVNLVFERLMETDLGQVVYDDHARLKAGQQAYDKVGAAGQVFSGPGVEVHFLSQQSKSVSVNDGGDETDESETGLKQIQQEAVLTAKRIRHLMGMDELTGPMQIMDKDPATGQMVLRGLQFRDIAILLRVTSNQAQNFARVLRQMDIPVYSDAETGYFQATEIQDMLALLEILDNPLQDIPLAAVLRSPLGGFTDSDLAGVRLGNTETAFHEAVFELAKQGNSGADGLAGRLNEFCERLAKWRELVRDVPLAQAIWEIYQETGYLHYVAGLSGGKGRQANLLRLYERARQFGEFARGGLSCFLQFLRDLQDREADLRMAPSISEAEDVVRIMSVHKSKGLEFAVVIMPRLSQKFDFRDAQGKIIFDRERYLGLEEIDAEQMVSYPTLGYRLTEDNIKRQVRAEEMRLLYVGLTRAREHLILIGSGKAKKLEPFEAGAMAEDVTGHDRPRAFELAQGNSRLDWLVPVLASLSPGELEFAGDNVHPELCSGQAVFVLSVHEEGKFAEDIFAKTRGKHHKRAGLTLADIAELETKAGLPEPDAELARSLELMDKTYAHEQLADLPAVVIASERKRLFEASGDEELEGIGQLEKPEELAQLKTVLGQKTQVLSAAEIGSLNHLFMQKVDLERACDAEDLKKQAKRMVADGVLDEAALGVVDIAGAVSFFASEIGQAMRANPQRVHREIPFVLAIEPGELAQGTKAVGHLDKPIVRGIIDVLVVEDERATIVDFKTDRVTEQDLPERAKHYQWQMEMYARAVKDILEVAKVRKMLYFLSRREVVQM